MRASMVSLLVLAACQTAPQAAAVKEQAPAFTATKLGGGEEVFEPTRLTNPTLIVFWASWCTSCKAELPHVLDIDRARKGHLDVLGVSVDEHPDRAESFARDANLPYPNVTDAKLVVADLFKVKGTPSFVLVARSGEVQYVGKAVDEGLLSAIEHAVQ